MNPQERKSVQVTTKSETKCGLVLCKMRYLGSGGRTCWVTTLIHFVICLSSFSSNMMSVTGRSSNETDRLALVAFKAKIREDPLGIMRLWNDSAHFCHWYGVTCSSRQQRVSQLNLLSLKLGGPISPHIGNLTFLRVLQLENNSFIGQIPPGIGRLRRLQVLNLLNNSLGGQIPSNLSSCSRLMRLYLHNNELEGEIPLELGFLSRLRDFGASQNHLTGALPPSLGNLTLLKTLYLAENHLDGRIPVALGGLNHLTELALGDNSFSGELPPSVFKLTSLEILDVGWNQIGGRLPSHLFDALPNLQQMSIHTNQFTGHIPASLSNASNMQILQLGTNQLTGKVPSLGRLSMLTSFDVTTNKLGGGAGANDDLSFLCSLTNATALQYLQMGQNNFGGVLPGCIADLSPQLNAMTMYQNYIVGSIPPGIGNLVGLQVLLLMNNSFTGTIPPTIGNLTNLVLFSLYANNLSGPIPSSLGKLSKLNKIDLSINSLEGAIPSSLSNCTSLQGIGLNQNLLIGSIPPQLLTIPSLSLTLSFSANKLTGELPEEVGKLTDLNRLDVSANELTGKIPDSLGECTSLQYLYLDSNHFQGPIPSSLSSLKGLQELSLSSNNLSGQIPQFLGSFHGLMRLDLSFNDLQGAVPTDGPFANASATSLDGNSKLCGGLPYFHLPACSSSLKRKKNKLVNKTKVTVAIVAGVTLLVLLLVAFGLRRRRRQSRQDHAPEPCEILGLQFVSYGDIHRATNGFSEGSLIGKGSFGEVYRGILHEGGEAVAIKVLKLEHLGASKSFVAECEALRNIRHKNLVKLLTVCSGVDYQGNEFKALVYEFMPNGSLQEWLHPPPTSTTTTREEEEEPPRKLGLLQRLSIASDVASLLEYVHHEFGTPLVHCDIKPSNILVDGDLSGRVSDFGIAKFLSDSGFIRGSIEPSSSIGVRGTVGYAPPEYGLGSEVSTQGDVYSFGILLLEMLTGKGPTHEMFKEGLSLHLYAKRALPSGVLHILDPIMKHLLETEEQVLLNPRRSVRVMDCLVSVVETGVSCSLESPPERMDMSMVTTQLRRIRDNLATR